MAVPEGAAWLVKNIFQESPGWVRNRVSFKGSDNRFQFSDFRRQPIAIFLIHAPIVLHPGLLQLFAAVREDFLTKGAVFFALGKDEFHNVDMRIA